MSRDEYLEILIGYAKSLVKRGIDRSELLQEWMDMFDEKRMQNYAP